MIFWKQFCVCNVIAVTVQQDSNEVSSSIGSCSDDMNTRYLDQAQGVGEAHAQQRPVTSKVNPVVTSKTDHKINEKSAFTPWKLHKQVLALFQSDDSDYDDDVFDEEQYLERVTKRIMHLQLMLGDELRVKALNKLRQDHLQVIAKGWNRFDPVIFDFFTHISTTDTQTTQAAFFQLLCELTPYSKYAGSDDFHASNQKLLRMLRQGLLDCARKVFSEKDDDQFDISLAAFEKLKNNPSNVAKYIIHELENEFTKIYEARAQQEKLNFDKEHRLMEIEKFEEARRKEIQDLKDFSKTIKSKA